MENIKYQEEISNSYEANKDILTDDNYLAYLIGYRKGMKHAETILTTNKK